MDLSIVTQLFDTLPIYVQVIALIVGSIVTTATAVTAITPSKLDDEKLPVITKPLNVILMILNTLAGNVLMNKNADLKK
jgi:hypothetical protein